MFDQFATFVYYFIYFPLVFGILSLFWFGVVVFVFLFFGGGGSSFDNLLYCIDLRSSVTVLENL